MPGQSAQSVGSPPDAQQAPAEAASTAMPVQPTHAVGAPGPHQAPAAAAPAAMPGPQTQSGVASSTLVPLPAAGASSAPQPALAAALATQPSQAMMGPAPTAQALGATLAAQSVPAASASST